jgi:V/A-type H+-transporting ATPase subunit E
MSGVERILDRIRSDADSSVSAILNEARNTAEDIQKSNQNALDILKADIKKQAEADAVSRLERLKGSAETEARKKALETRQELVEEAFAYAIQDLANLEETEKIRFLTKLVVTASISGKEEIVLSPADHARFGKKVLEGALAELTKTGKPAKLTLSSTPRDLEGGGGVVLHDGDVEVNCSYGALVSSIRDAITPEVAKILFV